MVIIADCLSVDGSSILPRVAKFWGDATVVTARAGEDKKPKHADELAWPQMFFIP